jgi:hypothetical protein
VPPRSDLRFDDATVERAIRHHRRALAALVEADHGGALPLPTRARLLARLQRDLAALETRLAQRPNGADS